LRAGLDAVIVTDHNVLVSDLLDYFRDGDRRVLLLIGEEIHDTRRDPQKNHCWFFGANRDLVSLAEDPQRLIDGVHNSGGLAFIAHPLTRPPPAFGEPDISWVSWEVQDFTGIELWNAMSELNRL